MTEAMTEVNEVKIVDGEQVCPKCGCADMDLMVLYLGTEWYQGHIKHDGKHSQIVMGGQRAGDQYDKVYERYIECHECQEKIMDIHDDSVVDWR